MNAYLSETEFLMNRMIQGQGHAPAWVEASKNLDEEVAKLRAELSQIRTECFTNQHDEKADTKVLQSGWLNWLTAIPRKTERPVIVRESDLSARSRNELWKRRGMEWAET